jgi:hypothetical protein
LLVKKQQCGQGLVLGRSRNATAGRQVIEKVRDFHFTQIRRMALVIKIDKPFDPMGIGLFGTSAVVVQPYGLMQPIQQARFTRFA